MKMKRPSSHLQTGMLLLCMVVLLIATSMLTVEYHCTEMDRKLARVMVFSEEADMKNAASAVDAALEQWEQSRRWLQLFVPRQSVAELNTGFAKLQPLAQAKNDELASECAALRAMLCWVGEQY